MSTYPCLAFEPKLFATYITAIMHACFLLHVPRPWSYLSIGPDQSTAADLERADMLREAGQ